jgi:hypothetical protein
MLLVLRRYVLLFAQFPPLIDTETSYEHFLLADWRSCSEFPIAETCMNVDTNVQFIPPYLPRLEVRIVKFSRAQGS